MTWELAYLGCFVLGLTFVGLVSLFGHLGGDAGGDSGDIGDAADMSDGVEGVGLPVFSPTVLAVFVGAFGGGGLALTRGLGLQNPVFHLSGATAVSVTTGFAVAWLMMKIIRHAESNSMGSHASLVGRTVEVSIGIRQGELGEIAFEAGGSRQTMLARAADGRAFAQGEAVQVSQVVEGVAVVAAPGTVPALQPVTAVSIGTPVAPIRHDLKQD